MSSKNMVLNRLFTQYTFRNLFNNNESNVYMNIVKRYIDDPSSKNNGEIISEIYSYMSKNYRNEYFYQNTLLNKLLLGKHSINTTTALTQVPIGKSKADFILINGKAVVYEIKTELDSFDRLKSQISDYYKAFDHVCIVTCEDNYEKINKLLENTDVGICILTDHNTLSFRKEPSSCGKYLDYNALFKVLHRKEFENIILKYFKQLPQTTPAFYYNECFKYFKEIPIIELYESILKQLKKRNKIVNEFFVEVHYELKSLMYFFSSFDNNYSVLNDFLQKEYRR